jgi:hypothetical protein
VEENIVEELVQLVDFEEEVSENDAQEVVYMVDFLE